MGITVREALSIGGLQKATLLGGESGLDNNIEYVNVIETPRFGRWLKGEELMISALYSMKQNTDDQIRVLEAMNNAGSSALVICYPELWGHISPLLVQKANEFGIPLLSIPEDVSYSDIMTPLSRAIAKIRMDKLEFVNNLHSTFSEIILQGKDLIYFADNLQELTRLPVALLNAEMKPVILSNLKAFKLAQENVALLNSLNRSNFYACPSEANGKTYTANLFPVRINRRVEGAVCLLTDNSALSEHANLAGEQAAIIYGWYILRDKCVNEALNRESRDFLDMLLSDFNVSEDSLKSRAASVGLNPNSLYCAAIISQLQPSNNQDMAHRANPWQKILYLINDKLFSKYPGSIAIQIGEKLVVIISIPNTNNTGGSRQELLKNIAALNSKILDHCRNCLIGLGRIYPCLPNLRQSYGEAVTATQLAKHLTTSSNVIDIDEIEDYAFLFAVKDKAPAILKQTMLELDKLKRLDNEFGTDLLKTLQALFQAEQNTSEAANLLFVHRNTIVYRKDKIKALLSKDPFDPANRFRFELALRFYALTNEPDASE